MDLGEIRKEIDKIDKEIAQLFQERMKRTNEVAAFKIKNGKKVFDKAREEEKLAVLSELTKDPFNRQGIVELFSQIMSISRKKQYTLISKEVSEIEGLTPLKEIPSGQKKVACFGEKGSYTEQAMEQFFGTQVEGAHKDTFLGVIEAISQGEVEYGVLPIENSSTGGINDIYDLLVKSNMYIIGECEVKIDQALIGMTGTKIEDIRKVYSHQQGILQCRTFLSQYPQIVTEEFTSTSGSVKKVKEEQDRTQAAIGSKRAAALYGLEVLQENINQESNNSTRFIVITNKKVYRKDGKKVSVCFEVPHESGSLYNMLSNFIFNHLNMTQIESRPIENKKWEYRFFVEFEGNIEDAGVKNAIRAIKEEADAFYFFGNF